LYGLFLEDILEEMGRLPQVQLALAFSPASARPFFEALSPGGLLLFPQAGPDLGERLTRAFAWGFAGGYGPVIIRNSDSPDLPGELVLSGQEALVADPSRVVLAPNPDGGYYLVGLTSLHPHLFRAIPWSTPEVLEVTLKRAREIDLAVHLLPPWPDIDTFADLTAFGKQAISPGAPGWRSFTWVEQHCRKDNCSV